MDFTLTTTKTEMYDTLKELFYHYRIRRQIPEIEKVDSLNLERMQAISYTEEEIRQMALIRLKPQHERELLKEKKELVANIKSLQTQIESQTESTNELIAKTEENYSKSIQKVQMQIEKNGIAKSSIIIDKIASLEDAKNQSVANISLTSNEKILALSAKKQALEEKLNCIEDVYAQIFNLELLKEQEKIKEEILEKQIEVFKYNNSISEKEQKHQASILNSNANIAVKISQVSSESYSKEQLVEMGYYTDAINCVRGYFDRLSPLEAAQEFKAETNLVIYLDDYYESILYSYHLNAV